MEDVYRSHRLMDQKNNYLLISVSVYLEWSNGGKSSDPMALVVYEKTV